MKIKHTTQGFLFLLMYHLLTLSPLSSRQCGSQAGNCWPVRNVLGRTPGPAQSSSLGPVLPACSSSFSSGSLEWGDGKLARFYPFSITQKTLCNPDPAQPTAIPPCRAKAKSQMKLNLAFLCFTLLLYPVLIFPLESLQKRGLTEPQPDLEISGFPSQIKY